MLLFEHRGNWLQRSLSPFPLPLAHRDSDLYSTHCFSPALYFNSYHSKTLNVCVLLIGQGYLRSVFDIIVV